MVRYFPAAQLLQELEPEAAWKEPAEQLVQLELNVAPVVARYFPAAQLLHTEEPVEAW